MKKFYLINNGTINKNIIGNLKDYNGKGLISHSGFLKPEYMGYAEFEFGAIPKFYRRVMQRLERDINSYELIDLSQYGITPINRFIKKGKFFAYVFKNEKEIFLESFKDYIEDLRDPEKIRNWYLKSWTDLDIYFQKDYFKENTNIDAWFCIDNINKIYIGDWFLFFGKQNTVDAFNTILMKDFNDWWLKLPEEIRKKNYNDIF